MPSLPGQAQEGLQQSLFGVGRLVWGVGKGMGKEGGQEDVPVAGCGAFAGLRGG